MTFHETRGLPPALPVAPLAQEELCACRGGGDHEDPWLWQILPWEPVPPIDPHTGTGPTFPSPPA